MILSTAPVLAAPCIGHSFQIQVDASHVGAGAVLLQTDVHVIERQVCYFSRKFKSHQLHYSTIEKEALALIWALQFFEIYLTSGTFPAVVFSDHNHLPFCTLCRAQISVLFVGLSFYSPFLWRFDTSRV